MYISDEGKVGFRPGDQVVDLRQGFVYPAKALRAKGIKVPEFAEKKINLRLSSGEAACT